MVKVKVDILFIVGLIFLIENVFKEVQPSEIYDLTVNRNKERTSIGNRLYYTTDVFTNPFRRKDFCQSKNGICTSSLNNCDNCQCEHQDDSFVSYQYGCMDAKKSMDILEKESEHNCSYVYFYKDKELRQLYHPQISPRSCTPVYMASNPALYMDCTLDQTLLFDNDLSKFVVLPSNKQHYGLTLMVYNKYNYGFCLNCLFGYCDLGSWNGRIVKIIFQCKLVDDFFNKCIIFKRNGKVKFKGSPFEVTLPTNSPEKSGIDSTTVAIIVIIILLIIAVSVIISILLWRKRKRKKQANCAHLMTNGKEEKSENIYNEFIPQQNQERSAENLYYQSSAAGATLTQSVPQSSLYEITYATKERDNAKTEEENMYYGSESLAKSEGERASPNNTPHYELSEIKPSNENDETGAIKQQPSYKTGKRPYENVNDNGRIDKYLNSSQNSNPLVGYEEVGSVLGPNPPTGYEEVGSVVGSGKPSNQPIGYEEVGSIVGQS